MKSTLLTVTLAAAALFVVAAPAEAQTSFHFSVGSGGYHTGHYRGGHGYHRPSLHSGYVHPGYSHGGGSHCASPVRKVRTSEVNRYSRPMTGYHHCGRPYTYWVTVVTYRDYYSNGTWRDYTRTFS